MKTFREHGFQGVVGVAEVDITPAIGIYARNWGAASHDQSEGNAKSLKAVCVTLSNSKDITPLIMISVDGCVWRSHKVKSQLYQYLLENFSLPIENLVICLTHTHAGPILADDLENKPGGKLNKEYVEFLYTQLEILINKSLEDRSECIITWKYGRCALAKNRDFLVPDSNKYAIGYNPLQLADDTLVVGRIYDIQKRKIKGLLVNYACHPTTLAWTNKLVSADYVGEMREYLNKELECPVLFIQGASGDLAPQLQYTNDLEVVKRNGKLIAYSVLAVLEEMLPAGKEMIFKGIVLSGADLAEWGLRQTSYSNVLVAQYTDVFYGLKELPSTIEISARLESLEISRVEREKLFRLKNLRAQFGDMDKTNIGLWIWKIGDGIFIGQQNEAYSAYQQHIRKAFPSSCIVVGNLVNGSAGYLPPEALYKKDCYTVNQTPFAAGSLEILLKTTLNQINRLELKK